MVDATYHRIKCSYEIAEIADLIQAHFSAQNPSDLISGVSDPETAGPQDLIYVSDRKHVSALVESKAKYCLVSEDMAEGLPDHLTGLIVPDVQRSYIKVVHMLYEVMPRTSKIHSTAQIDATAKLGENVTIGAFAVIEAGVSVGDDAVIEPHVLIDQAVTIGARTHIHSHCSISHSQIGANCTIYNGARIGQAGFGFLPGPDGHTPIPQLGRVLIKDGCTIGANVTIDRGALSDTIIGAGSIIDNLVHIAHNVKIGKGCVIIAQTGISGSSELGNYVVLAGQVGLSNHVKIGDGAQIAAKTGIMSDVPAGEKYMGYPARPLKQFFREVATLKKLTQKKDKA